MSGVAPPRACSNTSRPPPTAIVIDSAHDSTERRNPSLTATRETNPPCSRSEVSSVLQPWCTRVMGTPRSQHGYTRCAGWGALSRGVGELVSQPMVRPQPCHAWMLHRVPVTPSPDGHPSHALIRGGGVLLLQSPHQQRDALPSPRRVVRGGGAWQPTRSPCRAIRWAYAPAHATPSGLQETSPAFFQPVQLHLKLPDLLI